MTDQPDGTGSRRFVSLPVPEEDAIDVMELVVQREAARRAERSAPRVESATSESRWSVEQLARLAAGLTATTRTVAAILDVLSEVPEVWIPTTQLELETGIPRLRIKGALAKLQRHLDRHYPGRKWPFQWRWGGDDGLAEAHYCVPPDTAAAWKQVRAARPAA